MKQMFLLLTLLGSLTLHAQSSELPVVTAHRVNIENGNYLSEDKNCRVFVNFLDKSMYIRVSYQNEVVVDNEYKFYVDEKENEITSFRSTTGILVIQRKFTWLFSNGVIGYEIQIQKE